MAEQRRDLESRPSPDALLEAARQEGSNVGKLRIFVGAAPGVGKTYEMLQQAQAKRKEDMYSKIQDLVYSDPKLAQQILAKSECKAYEGDDKYALLLKEAKVQEMD